MSCCIINRHNGRSPDPKGNLHAEKVPEWVNSSASIKKKIFVKYGVPCTPRDWF